ncbi:MAG TPA: type IV toxin-antitoxin system AbiEi family antitoxin domain-containing protein [Longimicrobiales bacterium]|nr:type IV toxin-antitoxin system AbiEi family antitoxin domain-containing protein [Longimicrobiales bacterium]
MNGEIEARIGAVAARQHGVVIRRQLLELGFLPGTIRRRATSGWLRRLHRGVYLVGPVPPPRARKMAAVLACGLESLLSHWSAAALWTLAAPQAVTAPPDVSVMGDRAVRRAGIRIHRVTSLDPDERTTLDGLPVTTPARTLVDLAAVAASRDLERAVARAEREQLVSREMLAGLVTRYKGRPGVPALRATLDRSGGVAFTRSEAETRFLALVRKAGLPVPQTNVMVHGYEIDFLWPLQRLAVEVDGCRYHSSRSRFESDRRRSTHLAAHGIHVVHLTWHQIVHDDVATAVQIAPALLRAELR